jgi:hypothetical protein
MTTSGIITPAHRTFRPAPTRTLPSSPRRGSSHQVDNTAPAAAPSVLTPYSTPITDAARSSRCVSARASRGSDAPMKNVGHSRLTNRMPPMTGGDVSR